MMRRVRLNGRPPGRHSASEAGFTLVETLAALALSALLSVVLWGALSGGTLSARRILSQAVSNAALLRLDDRLRDVVGHVETPFWLSSPQVAKTENGLTVGRLNGDSERSAIFAVGDGFVEIGDGERTTRHGGLEAVRFSPARDGGEIVGVRLSLGGPTPLEIVARFGGRGLRTAQEATR